VATTLISHKFAAALQNFRAPTIRKTSPLRQFALSSVSTIKFMAIHSMKKNGVCCPPYNDIFRFLCHASLTIGQRRSKEPGKADTTGPDGAAPLHIAARHGHAGACEALCEVQNPPSLLWAAICTDMQMRQAALLPCSKILTIASPPPALARQTQDPGQSPASTALQPSPSSFHSFLSPVPSPPV
jgi:hypothetical protein